MKDNEIKSEVEEVAVTSEAQTLRSEEISEKESVGKGILANFLDQLILVACSCLLVVLIDLILKAFGYMFVRDNGALILAGGIVYFILNSIYVPAMEKSKLGNTIAKKILSI